MPTLHPHDLAFPLWTTEYQSFPFISVKPSKNQAQFDKAPKNLNRGNAFVVSDYLHISKQIVWEYKVISFCTLHRSVPLLFVGGALAFLLEVSFMSFFSWCEWMV